MDRGSRLGGSVAGIRMLMASGRGLAGVVMVCLAWVILVGILDRQYLWAFPDFGRIEEVGRRQRLFFRYMDGMIREANREILVQRERILQLEENLGKGRLNRREDYWLRRLGRRYGLKFPVNEELTAEHISSLLKRVDVIPRSMVLAQAAIETGWGTSYLAREGNNLFGMMTYEPQYGIFLTSQSGAETRAFRRYRTPMASVRDYMRNLNANLAYGEMREIRYRLRRKKRVPDGLTVASGLSRYSDEGWEYVDKVQLFIRKHKLRRYDYHQE